MDIKEDFSMFSDNLKSSQSSAYRDIKNFEEYVNGKITLDECFLKFKENNELGSLGDAEKFKRYIATLGWVK